MSSHDEISLRPIGFVRTNAIGNQIRDKSRLSQILIERDYAVAMDGLSKFSHLFVIFFLHKVSDEERKIMRVHPRGRKDMPLLGIFATRTMFRPNPIGLTLVELIKIESNVLTVRGLDAIDRTPVLDIKPFDFWDTRKKVKVPDWWKKLEHEREQSNLIGALK